MRNCDVLVVASRHSREVDGVIDGLRETGLRVGRLSPCQFPESDFRSWRSEDPHATFGNPKAAWLVDFSGWSIEQSLVGVAREAALAETAAFAEGALLSLDARWLNAPVAVRTASRKLLQLQRALALGIATPKTCATNSTSVARQFVGSVGRAIAKPLAASFMNYGSSSIKFYTREVDAQSDDIFSSLHFSPLIFQERIVKAQEVRVTVVDDWAVAVRVDLSNLELPVPVDTRRLDYAANRAHFSQCSDCPDLLNDSKRIVRELGLSYGGVDWAIDREGKAFFLECNPLGAFKWFELCSNENITKRLVDALVRRCGPTG